VVIAEVTMEQALRLHGLEQALAPSLASFTEAARLQEAFGD
jgi:hypothetical protein